MPAPLIAAIAGIAGQAGASAIGEALASGDRAKAARLLEQIMAEYGMTEVPNLPELAAEQLGPSAMEGVQTQLDPRLREAQMRTLDGLADFAQDGDSIETKAAMNRVMGDVSRQETAGRNAILNNMRARGVAGSGAELAAQLSNQQASANRGQDAGLDIAAQAKRRMYDAMLARGQVAGSLRGQEYGEKSDAAKARDLVSRYNADSRTHANHYNAQLPQRNFDNRMGILQGKSNAAAGQASNLQRGADRTSGMFGGIGRGINQGMASIGDWMNDEDDREGGR